jgi:hypothetical protein
MTIVDAFTIAGSAAAVITLIGGIVKVRQRPRLRLYGFEPTHDGIVKAPEFSYGPSAWLRLRVKNTSHRTRAKNVQVVINRVLPHSPDDRPRDNLRHLALKWADHEETKIDLEPGEERLVDLMKMNAAWSQVADEPAYRVQHPRDPPLRERDVPQDRPEVWALVLQQVHDDLRQELTVDIEYDLELAVKAQHSAGTRYTTRLACEGWPCAPPWPCDTTRVWRSFRLAEPLIAPRRGPVSRFGVTRGRS